MNFADWYTDLMNVYRVADVMDGALTRQERMQVGKDIPCRIYQSDSKAVNMTQDAANIRQEDKLMCAVSVDIQTGDELIIRRGARIGKPGPVIRAFAGDPNLYYEPFGAVLPGLAHQEIKLLQQERVKGGATDDISREDEATPGDAASN